MAYFTEKDLLKLGFKSVGKNVKISKSASIYNFDQITIGDFSRIDDFCVISGSVTLGRNVHITPQCLVAGGSEGVICEDFSTLAYQVKIFSQSDDYSGNTMANSTVPKKYKNEVKKSVSIGRHVIIGAGSTIMPGVHLAEGTSVGAMSIVLKDTESWFIYAGAPAEKIRKRSRGLLLMEKNYLASEKVSDSF